MFINLVYQLLRQYGLTIFKLNYLKQDTPNQPGKWATTTYLEDDFAAKRLQVSQISLVNNTNEE